MNSNWKSSTPYGYCPRCGALGIMRERRLNGNDQCVNNHGYPSSEAVYPDALHPVQKPARREQSKISSKVTLAAYEVYSHIFQPQLAIITGNCRGGFTAGELICLLYARNFPKSDWKTRFHEAMEGLVNL